MVENLFCQDCGEKLRNQQMKTLYITSRFHFTEFFIVFFIINRKKPYENTDTIHKNTLTGRLVNNNRWKISKLSANSKEKQKILKNTYAIINYRPIMEKWLLMEESRKKWLHFWHNLNELSKYINHWSDRKPTEMWKNQNNVTQIDV